MARRSLAAAAAVLFALLVLHAPGAPDAPPDRGRAMQLMQQGNHKEAYEQLARLVLDPADDPKKAGEDLANAVQCLRNLNRQAEIDAFREKAVAAHPKTWRVLASAARTLFEGEHYGFIVAGEFKRGHHRGGGQWGNPYERDRARALQLLVEAVKATTGENDRAALAQLYLSLADVLMGASGYGEAWRLQVLTDLATLPDVEPGYYYGHGGDRGAPVDADGNPVFHRNPKSWEAAASDGERWRWAMVQAEEADPRKAPAVRRRFADFLLNQFDVQTLVSYGGFFGRMEEADDTKKDESGTWALHTLGDDETIARLATGVRRFKLPDEYNFLAIYKELNAHDVLASIYENRRQYPKAAERWRQAGQQDRVDQIVKPWGMFEGVMTQPAGSGATVDFRFRNGAKVAFEAHAVDVKKLLDDVKAYLTTKPRELDWEKLNIADVGWRILEKNQRQYLGPQVAAWTLDLKPRPAHFDKRVTVATPLQKAGAYFVTARMEGGNTSHIVLWVADTAIVKKPLDQAVFYYVADAVTGQPVAKANVELFGYRADWVNEPRGRGYQKITTRQFAEFTDADGQLVLDTGQQPANHQWIVTATTPEGRMAFLGFTGTWYGRWADPAYQQDKTFVITDRPVYRPKQTVQFKVWVDRAQYDREGRSPYAGREFTLRIFNPKNEKVLEKAFTADEFGGFNGELALPADATLGVYRINLNHPGGGSFRVEEYKKPEFEVKVEAPEEPVLLGEKVTAKVQAKYYFGAPVSEAKVKYKVTRTEHDARWYPPCPWDWFYGPGYWWFAYDYAWWPGWRGWGCAKPTPWWWQSWGGRQPPEVVAEGEAPIGKDGTLAIPIDTALAKAVHPDDDHRYAITAEVTDASRRTIVGTGAVLVARKPFKVYAWVDRGYCRTGDALNAHFCARTLDGKPVAKAAASVRLLKVSYKDGQPVEAEVQAWDLATDADGQGRVQMKAAAPGQYRVVAAVTDAKNHKIEGAYVFVVYGEGGGGEYRFNDLELVPDKREYAPGETVQLLLNADRRDSCVLLFDRPANGIYRKPKLLRLKGKSVVEPLPVEPRDMPNFFVEAVAVGGGKVFSEAREIVVPPASRVANITLTPSATEVLPGAKATVKVKASGPDGKPFAGSLVVSMYDKSVEYISGGSNVPEIKAFFWKWRRHHRMGTEQSLSRGGHNLVPPNTPGMSFLGVFGQLVTEETNDVETGAVKLGAARGGGVGGGARAMAQDGAPMAKAAAATTAPGRPMEMEEKAKGDADAFGARRKDAAGEPGGDAPGLVQPTVRSQFADTAFWAAALKTDAAGEAEVAITMPENLTAWKTRAWVLGDGARCGEASVEIVTKKNLILRLQAPRFFTQKDEVVLSANVHNYLKDAKRAQVALEMDGGCLEPMPGTPLTQAVDVAAGGEKRVDWRVRVTKPGEAVVRMKALTDAESDAMEMRFPAYVHGMLKTESFCGVIRPDKDGAALAVRVPAERRPEETRLEIRYSPTLALAMVDALPYLVEYPYGCTEQTLNRFLPTVITQKVLLRTGVRLEDIQKKITNLNAQEIGEDAKRAKDWERLCGTKRWDGERWVDRNPVYDERLVLDMVKAGVEKLTSMQCSDGGWGWFTGWGERSYPHTTAVVVHGLQVARANDVAIVPGVIDRGIAWLKRHQAEQVQWLQNWPLEKNPRKKSADNLDALVYSVLVDEKVDDPEMRELLYRDRNDLSVYAKAMIGLAYHKAGQAEKRDMCLRNVEQLLVQDEENQTAHLNLGNGGYWWCWYGSEIEAHAYYLKLLAAVDPKGEKASRLVKYLLNNRRHGTYWNSTRDTALAIEAFADYIKASGEDRPELEVEIAIDGRQVKKVRIDADNLFAFDNKLVVKGADLPDGERKIAIRRTGKGPLYWNAYLTNFTMEDPIAKAGLEVKVERSLYKLVPVDKKVKDADARGGVVDRKVEKYERVPVANDGLLKSGDLLEVELVMESKNDYEYILFEDLKAAGCEPVEVRSGYGGNAMGAYMELRDERVTFFVRQLARGKHSLSYRLRAEIPGRFSALPAKASAMYAPELKANSDENKIRIED